VANGRDPPAADSTGGGDPSGGADGAGGAVLGGMAAGGAGDADTGGASAGADPGGTSAGGTPADGGGGGFSAGGNGGANVGGPLAGGTPAGGSGGGGASTAGAPSGGAEAGGAEPGGAGACDDPGTPRTGGNELCDRGEGDLDNGYHYQFWALEPGTACMTVFGDDGTFRCDWDETRAVLARSGRFYDGTRTPDPIGEFAADFAATGSGTGLVFLGVHGSVSDPPVELYIIEDWTYESTSSFPSLSPSLGTVVVDGGTYGVHRQTVGESIPPLQQYYSIRTEGRRCGHVSISEHFSQWAALDMPLGPLEQVTLFVEHDVLGSGSIEFTRAAVTVR
jgi:endo-1,4-beta-xylanase